MGERKEIQLETRNCRDMKNGNVVVLGAGAICMFMRSPKANTEVLYSFGFNLDLIRKHKEDYIVEDVLVLDCINRQVQEIFNDVFDSNRVHIVVESVTYRIYPFLDFSDKFNVWYAKHSLLCETPDVLLEG